MKVQFKKIFSLMLIVFFISAANVSGEDYQYQYFIEKDEYVRENTVYPHDLNDKSGDLQNSINILSPIAPTKSDEGGEEK